VYDSFCEFIGEIVENYIVMPVIDRYDSMKLLSSSSSQYLPPDYLQPLQTTVCAVYSFMLC